MEANLTRDERWAIGLLAEQYESEGFAYRAKLLRETPLIVDAVVVRTILLARNAGARDQVMKQQAIKDGEACGLFRPSS